MFASYLVLILNYGILCSQPFVKIRGLACQILVYARISLAKSRMDGNFLIPKPCLVIRVVAIEPRLDWFTLLILNYGILCSQTFVNTLGFDHTWVCLQANHVTV